MCSIIRQETMLSNILGTLGSEKTQFRGVRLAKVGAYGEDRSRRGPLVENHTMTPDAEITVGIQFSASDQMPV